MYKISKEINKYIFRGYDIRGFADKDLNEDVYYTLGRAYATFLSMRRIKKCPVGRDNRLTSEIYSKAFITGLNDGGVDCIDLGLSLSQIVYFSSYEFKTRACAMVTGSHNPGDMNGLKLGVGYSETMISEEVQKMREICESKYFSEGKGRMEFVDVYPSYKKTILDFFSFKKRWKIVVDCGNSASGKFYPDILRSAGLEVIEQNNNLDGNYPLGAPDPTEKDFLDRIAKKVLETKSDIGFGYDSDGDRMSVVDNNGRVLWMDSIIALFAKDVLENLPGSKIVFNTLCSKVVPDVIEKMGGNADMWITGHSFIKERVKSMRAPFGGELSGHIFFMDNFFGHDDGAYSSLRLLSYLERRGKNLSDEIALLPTYKSSPEIKLGCPDDIKIDFVRGYIKESFQKLWPNEKYTEIDGIRVDGEDFMAIVRASQNGPYLTVKFEARNDERYRDVGQAVYTILKDKSEIDWEKGVNVSSLKNV